MNIGKKNLKVVVIGLDGATFDIIDPMIEQGKLPNLENMIRNGSRGTLLSVIPPYSPPAWISMLTGKNPGKHGVFHFLKRKDRSYDLEVTSFNDIREKTMFSILSRQGIGSGVMNIPMTYPPPDDIPGFFVSGIPVPPQSRSYAVPPPVLESIEREGYEVDYDFRGFDPNREEEENRWDKYDNLYTGLTEIARKRVDIFLDLMEREDLPLFFYVISLIDRVQHYYWRFTDKNHPGYSEEGNRKFGDAIQGAYVLADEFIGRIMERCGDQVNYLLVSDHGAGPHYGDFHLNNWLIENGFLTVKKVPRWVIKHGPLRHVLNRLGMGFVGVVLPDSIVSRIVPYPGRKSHRDNTDIVWARTKAFSSMFGIRVNLKGREPDGIVDAGDEYTTLIDQLKIALARLENPIDGRKLLTDSITKEAAFSGPYLNGSPDLFLNLGDISVLPTESWVFGNTCVPRRNCPSSGTHRIEGIFIGSGPAFVKGADIGETKIEDVMPTVLHLFDLPLPRDIDGHVVQNSLVDRRPVKIQRESSEEIEDVRSGKGYTEEEENQIEENLRGMGYI
jgi:predicted AlkP superfamily phosphohydrolase/phosphomutase